MQSIHIAAVASAIALLVGSCSLGEDPPAPSAEKSPAETPAETPGQAVTIERTLPCDDVAPIAEALIGQVDSSVAREPGERFAPLPDAKKVAEATYFCAWRNESADAAVRIYPQRISSRQAERVWGARTQQTSGYGGYECIQAPAGFGDVSMGVVCAYGPDRSVLQVLGLFGDSLVECWHTRAGTEPVDLAEQGMEFCWDVIAAIGETSAVS